MAITPVPSPCILVCHIDETHGYCLGCCRSRAEIARWAYYSDAEKEAVWAELGDRAKAHGLPAPRAREGNVDS